MPAKLYALSLSHPSLAARAMLEHKGIEHEVVDLIPGMHPLQLRARRFPGHTVPALVVDGRRVQGSREISRFLDELQPDPPLFPREPEARRRVEEAERWGEEVLQSVPRRIFRWAAANDYESRRWLAVDIAKMPGGALIARPSLQAKAFARAVDADDAAVQADVAALLPVHLAEVERLRAEGVIGGAERNAADFQIASSVRSLAKLGDLEPYLADHPAVRWAAAVVPAQPGPTPRALPREWLRPLEA
jgi:glutathione S-transferase